MILTIVLGLLCLLIAYVHYVQGFFSSTLSAIIAAIAAVVSVSYHESIVESLLGGHASNNAHAMVLLILFPVIYLLLRILFDSLVPGQIRLPAMVDKIGGAVMGLAAGAFATGIVAIAMQELPLGPSVMGYVRYDTAEDRSVAVPQGQGKMSKSATISDELKSDTPGVFDPTQVHSLYVDDFVVNTVAWLSNGGSLAGRQPLVAIHPDLLTELFGQRLGIEPGGKRVALNLEKQQVHHVRVDGVFSIDSAPQADSEMRGWRPTFAAKAKGLLKASGDSLLLVVRVTFLKDSADPDFLVRVSPGAVRLVAPANADAAANNSGSFVDYYPLGTLQTATTLYLNKLDDPLFLDLHERDKAADFVFQVKKEGLLAEGSKRGALKLGPGVFIEVKRLGRVDLAGKPVKVPITVSNDVDVMRKEKVLPVAPPVEAAPPVATATPAPSPTPAPTPAPVPAPAPVSLHSPQAITGSATNGILAIGGVTQSAQLPIAISTGQDAGKLSVSLPGGDGILKGDKFLSLNLDVSETVDKLSAGPRPIKDLLAPEGQGLVQVAASVPGGGWAWAEKADQFALVDGAGNRYPANGAWANVDDKGGKKFLARYSSNYPLGPVTPQSGTITSLWLCFNVPNGTEVKQLVAGTDVVGDFPPVKVGQ